MKKKFYSCFLGCILAGFLLTSPVAAFSFLSDGDLKNPGDATRITWQEDGETNVTLHYIGGNHNLNGNNWINRYNRVNNRWRHQHRPRHSNAPIPSAILLFGSGILGLVGIKIRTRKKI